MNSTKLIKFGISGLAVAAVLAGCNASSDNNNITGAGGSSSTGGTTGTGGTSSTGGTTGTGGTSSTGGTTGTGGLASTGGTTGGGGATGAGGVSGGAGQPGGGSGSAGTSGGMTLTSPDQAEGAKFGTMFTCAAMNGTFGSGVNPELDWSNAPDGTMSFAITFIDTTQGASSPMGQHWAIWNIPGSVRQFPKGTTTLTGALAGAMQTNKYLAPCPSGNDMYEFTLYALSEASLNISGASGSGTANSAGVAKVLAALKNVTPLATATLHGTSGAMGK